jgi:hypothetical protein
MANSLTNFQRYEAEGVDFSLLVVTGDEMWLQH